MKLNDYLQSIEKYFTSNSQFYFQPGKHFIDFNLNLIGVHNLSLIGRDAQNTIIHCESQTGIKMMRMTNLTIVNLTILNCKAKGQYWFQNATHSGSLVILYCYNVYLSHIRLLLLHNVFYDIDNDGDGRLLGINLLGKTILTEITGREIKVFYNDNVVLHSKMHTLTISKYKPYYAKSVHNEEIDQDNYFYDDINSYGEYENYDDSVTHAKMLPHGFQIFNIPKNIYNVPAIDIALEQSLFGVSIEICDTTIEFLEYFEIVDIKIGNLGKYKNVIVFKNCTFSKNFYKQLHAYGRTPSLIFIELPGCTPKFDKAMLVGSNGVKFINCLFSQNDFVGSLINVACNYKYCLSNKTQIATKIKQQIIIIAHCLFEQNILVYITRLFSSVKDAVIFHVISTQFKELNTSEKGFEPNIGEMETGAIHAINVTIFMKGPITFYRINVNNNLIYSNTEIAVTSNITFSNITSETLVGGEPGIIISLISNTYIDINGTSIKKFAFAIYRKKYDLRLACLLYLSYKHEKITFARENDIAVHFHPLCFFQYYQLEAKNDVSNYKIVIHDNFNNNIFDFKTGNINCKFNEGSLFYGLNPLEVYQKHFHFTSKAEKHPLFNTGLLCYCLNKAQSNCLTNIIGPLFPGETFEFYFKLNPSIINENILPISVKAVDEDHPESVCKISSLLQAEQLITKNCTKISYTILAENEKLCKLILYNIRWHYPTYFYVRLYSCPLGFVFSILAKSCICDPLLTIRGIIGDLDCDINYQSILRPPNSWISATAHNNSYTYHISLHCPFHYCLPHSSHLNFSTPNSQCQFNRSGLLCGHCQQGLSTVFSSSHCKRTCSNIHLLLIIPIIVFGFLLVILLFILNLTVTDGTVNGFILYVNIISINTPILFPDANHYTPAYTFISFANLDLGIQTCFYNGMDDYAKMWLQLAFPFYLIFIATLIIITSRYSTKVQRLTARRALPVLATLFLLSYTKILRIVSNVLFFYSTIIHLPSKHTTLVWSVDANVPLFGVRFTILFIVCLILFLILVPFNAILLFTRTLSRFNVINKFKPLLDAYQGPYKIRFYYWTGLQLLMRAVFFGTSSLDRNLNLTIGIVLFSMTEVMQGAVKPFKGQIKNLQEQLFLINISVIYAFLLYDQAISKMMINIMIAMAAIHFVFIIMYHIINYVCSTVIKDKVKSGINAIIKWVNTLQRKSPTDHPFELDNNIRCSFPEAVNYHEFQEPLVIQD